MLGHCQTDHAFENDSTTWASWMWQKELTLSGNLDKSLKVSGEISSNGYKLEEFVPQKTSAYVSQNCLHIPEMTVKETLDYSSRFQGVGSRAEIFD